jgi:hypothetical protein
MPSNPLNPEQRQQLRRQCTLIVPDFASLTPANDLVFRRGTDSPTVRIDDMTLAGA